MTAPKKRTPSAATDGVQGDHVAGDQGDHTATAATVATAVAILNGIADDLIGWGYPLEGQILRARAHTVRPAYAADIVGADTIKTTIDPAESRLRFELKTDGERHVVRLRLFKRPAGGER